MNLELKILLGSTFGASAIGNGYVITNKISEASSEYSTPGNNGIGIISETPKENQNQVIQICKQRDGFENEIPGEKDIKDPQLKRLSQDYRYKIKEQLKIWKSVGSKLKNISREIEETKHWATLCHGTQKIREIIAKDKKSNPT